MAKRSVICLCGCLVWALSAVAAETQGPEPLEIGPAGTAYLEALRFRGIDTDVGYFDPTRPAPALEAGANPPQPEPDSGTRTGTRLTIGLPAVLLLAAIGYLFIRYGGGLAVSFGREGEPGRRGATGSGNGAAGPAVPPALAAILAIADRRTALVTLAEAALMRSVAAQGLLFQKSWTARDALRRLPSTWTHWEDLRALVLASERVHFGGRDVSEEEFRAHVTRIRPILEGAGG